MHLSCVSTCMYLIVIFFLFSTRIPSNCLQKSSSGYLRWCVCSIWPTGSSLSLRLARSSSGPSSSPLSWLCPYFTLFLHTLPLPNHIFHHGGSSLIATFMTTESIILFVCYFACVYTCTYNVMSAIVLVSLTQVCQHCILLFNI